MVLDGKIVKMGEIKEAKKFEMKDTPFYILLAPKAATDKSVEIVKAKPNRNDVELECPITLCAWNAAIFDNITVTTSILSSYRVFWGTEY